MALVNAMALTRENGVKRLWTARSVRVFAGDYRAFTALYVFRLLSSAFLSLSDFKRRIRPSQMQVEEKAIVEKILRHCDLWKEPKPHPPPALPIINLVPPVPADRVILDYDFFERNCA
jgi:hypothetical protein